MRDDVHSPGAVVALDSALRLPIVEVAVYEPPMLGEFSPPMDGFPKLEARQTGRAFAILANGLQMGLPSWIPIGAISAFAWLGGMTRWKEGADMLEELLTLPAEFASARGRKASDCALLSARLLLMDGSESPDYLRHALKRLAESKPRSSALSPAHNLAASRSRNGE